MWKYWALATWLWWLELPQLMVSNRKLTLMSRVWNPLVLELATIGSCSSNVSVVNYIHEMGNGNTLHISLYFPSQCQYLHVVLLNSQL